MGVGVGDGVVFGNLLHVCFPERNDERLILICLISPIGVTIGWMPGLMSAWVGGSGKGEGGGGGMEGRGKGRERRKGGRDGEKGWREAGGNNGIKQEEKEES